jgi:hypothetical protein
MHFPKSSAILAALASAAILSACGSSGSSGVSAAAYVKAVCNAVGPFEKDITSRSQSLNSSLTSAAQGKKLFTDFLTASVNDADQLLTKIKAAGTPNVSNGNKISAAFITVFTRLRNGLAQAQSQAANLPTSSLDAFRTAAQTLAASVQSSMSNIGAGFSGLKSPELEAAAKKEPACQSIGA